ncbi:amidase [Cryobacterium sp. TMT1-3]|uniref:Amidase n=1 Tax=Cryobacterium luteum TaxID=1424661 RepID=A0A1H8ESS9_9MICO|nr:MULTISPECIES: amidase [Cryobacterium]TFB85773.1 amidase [Cryobacterium luteum]TFC31390.1 amidase [Cryobacterium sp. TMT1-3]SEN21798.1 aspartyl-tRNA(Asn)/glutamyl-tRNA(Gln) amidotransferase subunit A [Cryobacterium luteum]
MAETAPIECLPATELVRRYRSGDLSPVEVTAAVLDKAERLQPELNCFWGLDRVGALAAAAASERRWAAGMPRGPIDGVPTSIKENVAVRGFSQPSGTAAKFDAPVATVDGPSAARVREAGGVIFGVTVMPDYGMLSSGVSSLHGVTRSPWNPAWTVGGSSAGAGAAAAAGIGPLHLGSDIGGSLRLPATWLGLVTLKPSFGRVAVDPPYMGRVAGPLTRTVDDAALFLGVLTRPDPRDYTALGDQHLDWTDVHCGESGVTGLKVGFHLAGGAGLSTDPEVAASVLQAVELFAAAGAIVEQIAPPMTAKYLADLDLFLRVRSLADYEVLKPARQALVLDFIRDWVLGGAGVSGTEVVRCYQSIQDLRAATVAATAPYDVVLSPVSPVAAFPAEWPMPTNDAATSLDHIAFTAPYNFSEQPASSVNCGFTADGRPIGLHIAGRRFEDLAVLRATHWYEQARPAAAEPVWPFHTVGQLAR